MVRRAAPLLGLAVAAAALVAPLQLAAQETIASDRPGIGSGAYVLGTGMIQIEAGIATAQVGGVGTHSLGQLVARFGFAPLELDLFPNSYVAANRNGALRWGIEDMGIGLKVPVHRSGGRATVALQGILVGPTGSHDVTADRTTVSLIGLTDIALSDRAALSLNAGWTSGDDAEGDLLSLIVTPGMALGSGLGVYGGWAGTFFTGGGNDHVAELGFTYLASDDLQLDLNGGVRTRESGDNWFVGVGIATRWLTGRGL